MADVEFDTKPYESNAYLQSVGLQGKGGSTTPPAMTAIDSFKAQEAALNKREEGLLAEKAAEGERETSEIEQHKQREQQLFGRQFRAMNEMPQLSLQDVQKPPVQQPKSPFEAFQNPAVWIALLGSAFTRAPMTAALNAGAAAMKGFREGNVEEMKRKQEEWKDRMQQVLEQNKIEMERYQAAWKTADRDVATAMAKLQAEAAGFKNDQLMALIRSGNIDSVQKYLDGLRKADTDLWKATAQIDRYQQSYDQRERFHQDTQKRFEANITPEDAQTAAEQYLAGDKSVLQNWGRGIQGGANLVQIREAITQLAKAKGMGGKEIAEKIAQYNGDMARFRTLGSYGARVDQAAREVEKFIPQALDASAKLPRGKFVPLNHLINQEKILTSDPKYYDFAFANWSLINAYARAINPTGVPRVEDKKHADELLSMAVSQESYRAMLNRMALEVQAAQQATHSLSQGAEPADLSHLFPENQSLPNGNDEQWPPPGWDIKERP